MTPANDYCNVVTRLNYPKISISKTKCYSNSNMNRFYNSNVTSKIVNLFTNKITLNFPTDFFKRNT